MLCTLLATFLPAALPQEPPAAGPRDLAALLAAEPACKGVLAAAASHRLQILLAEPLVAADGVITLRRSRLGDPQQYFYPASAIKLCGAIAAVLKLSEHNRAHGKALGLASSLAIEPRFAGDQRIDTDPENIDGGALTLGHALRELFLVSDNAAYNHCFDLCGQDGLNACMWNAGFDSARLWHRLSESRSLAESAVTRAVRVDDVLFAARDAAAKLDNGAFTELDVGIGVASGGKVTAGPMSFAQKNAILLQDLQDMLVAVLRPEIRTGRRGFPELSVGQRAFLVQALGEFPRESPNPRYDAKEFPDHHCKFVLRGVEDVLGKGNVRVWDKIGRAYGFSIENAWIEDVRTGRGFFLAIVIYTNPDGVLNDDRYGYDEIADPFLDGVARAIARAMFRRD
jgi:hypothetical protein